MQSHLTAPTAQVRFRHVQPHGQAAFELELHARFCKHRVRGSGDDPLHKGARQREARKPHPTLTLNLTLTLTLTLTLA